MGFDGARLLRSAPRPRTRDGRTEVRGARCVLCLREPPEGRARGSCDRSRESRMIQVTIAKMKHTPDNTELGSTRTPCGYAQASTEVPNAAAERKNKSRIVATTNQSAANRPHPWRYLRGTARTHVLSVAHAGCGCARGAARVRVPLLLFALWLLGRLPLSNRHAHRICSALRDGFERSCVCARARGTRGAAPHLSRQHELSVLVADHLRCHLDSAVVTPRVHLYAAGAKRVGECLEPTTAGRSANATAHFRAVFGCVRGEE